MSLAKLKGKVGCDVAHDDIPNPGISFTERFEIVSESAEGLTVQSENGTTVALDIRISEELRLEGLAREFVNRVQNMRKNAGFDVIDRINIYYETSSDLLKAIENRRDYICNETLAEELSQISSIIAAQQN